jgi:hypothetical protein
MKNGVQSPDWRGLLASVGGRREMHVTNLRGRIPREHRVEEQRQRWSDTTDSSVEQSLEVEGSEEIRQL